MNLITDDWRLKLLAVGLAILLLGAVAFSQNPPTTKTLQVPINYTRPTDLVLIHPPARTSVTVNGLADVIGAMTSDNIVAVADASKASPGPSVNLNVTARSLVNGVTVQTPAPIAVDIDALATVDLEVTVVAHAANGWLLTKHDAVCPGTQPTQCVVHFTGPKTWEVNLKAQVIFSDAVNVVGPIDRINQQIQLVNNNGTLDQSCTTVPCTVLDPPSVAIHIEAKTGSTSTTVPLVAAPYINSPAPGYRVVGITINPGTVVITGDAAVLGRIQRITLPAIDLSGKTTNYASQVQIPYPANVTGQVQVATVTYQIQPDPAVSPLPTPT